MMSSTKITTPDLLEKAFAPYEQFSKAMLDAFALVDHDGKVIKANQLFYQLVERKAKQVLRTESIDTMLRLFIKDKPLSIKELLSYEGPTRIDEVRGENDSHKDLNLIIGIYPFFSTENKASLGSFVLIRDVTAEKNLHDIYTTAKTSSITDPLTGIFTRRYFDDLLTFKQQTNANMAPDTPRENVALLMIDIDHFKNVNDVHGHQAGDQVLKTIGKTLLNGLRKTDTPCRYGGEEFLVILSATDLEGAKVVAEKLRIDVEITEFAFEDQKIPITISCGIAEIYFNQETYQETIKRADDALYVSKKSGRNRTSAHTGSKDQGNPIVNITPDETAAA